MPATTRIPAATDALVALCTSALPTVDVVDGPPLDWGKIKLRTPQLGDGTRFLFIGAQPDGDTAAESEIDFNAAGAVSRDERFTITCTAIGWSGDGVTKTARDLAYAVLAAVESTIVSNQTISGTVLYALVSTVDRQDAQQNDRGVSVPVVFRVACRAYLS